MRAASERLHAVRNPGCAAAHDAWTRTALACRTGGDDRARRVGCRAGVGDPDRVTTMPAAAEPTLATVTALSAFAGVVHRLVVGLTAWTTGSSRAPQLAISAGAAWSAGAGFDRDLRECELRVQAHDPDGGPARPAALAAQTAASPRAAAAAA